MHYVQTRISKQNLADLRYQAVMQDKSLQDLLHEIITNYLKEDEQCQKNKKQLKLPNAQENS
jgi:hypothetical protein